MCLHLLLEKRHSGGFFFSAASALNCGCRANTRLAQITISLVVTSRSLLDVAPREGVHFSWLLASITSIRPSEFHRPITTKRRASEWSVIFWHLKKWSLRLSYPVVQGPVVFPDGFFWLTRDHIPNHWVSHLTSFYPCLTTPIILSYLVYPQSSMPSSDWLEYWRAPRPRRIHVGHHSVNICLAENKLNVQTLASNMNVPWSSCTQNLCATQ